MRRRAVYAGFAVGVAMAMLGIASLAGPVRDASALTNCSVPVGDIGLDSSEQQFLALVNNFRAANGRAALAASPTLSRAAEWKSRDPSATGSGGVPFSHTDSLGRAPKPRVVDCGYNSGAGVGENIAHGSGYASAQAVFQGFVASVEGHKENMLFPYWTVVGIGQESNGRWTVDFGSYNDSGLPWPTAEPPAPTNTPYVPPATATTGETLPPPPQSTQAPPAQPPSFSMQLKGGENYVVFTSAPVAASEAFAAVKSDLVVVYHWNAQTRRWERFVPLGPSYVNSFSNVVPGELYVLMMKRSATWRY